MLSLLQFENGAQITFGASWDVYRHTNREIELHGTEGSLGLPDPDNFSGTISLSNRGQPWMDTDTSKMLFGALNLPVEAPDRGNYRMLGLADLAAALREGREPRASGDLALHVLEVMEAILAAGQSGQAREISPSSCQPPALSDDQASKLLA